MKNGKCRRKLTSAGCVFYVNRNFSGLNGKMANGDELSPQRGRRSADSAW